MIYNILIYVIGIGLLVGAVGLFVLEILNGIQAIKDRRRNLR